MGRIHAPAAVADEVLLTPEGVGARPRRPMAGAPGVTHRVLWADGRGSVAGTLYFDVGAHMPTHRHADASHHVWVVRGVAVVDDRPLPAGGYAYVPPGRPHEVCAPDGCTLFYLYLRELERPAGDRYARNALE
jgi:quercetin dioxygenase-like cupin family protein